MSPSAATTLEPCFRTAIRTRPRRPRHEPLDDPRQPAGLRESWIAVREDQVLRPDGQPGIYGVVHFKNRAVGVLPVEDDGRVWLVGQYRYPLDRYSWEIPEGGGPEGEAPEEAARRELREETGLVAGRLELLAMLHLSNSVSDELAYLFRATGLTPGPASPRGPSGSRSAASPGTRPGRMLRRARSPTR